MSAVIILKILLFTFLSLIGIILLLLLLPFTVGFSYENTFRITVSFAGLRVYDSRRKRKNGKPQQNEEKTPSEKQKKPNAFETAREKLGLTGAVRYYTELLKAARERLKKYFRHLRFRNFKMRLSVGTGDAAETACVYGIVCSAVYPALNGLLMLSRCKAKSIDISADFDNAGVNFAISAAVSSQLVFLIAAAAAGFCEYKKIRKVSFDE